MTGQASNGFVAAVLAGGAGTRLLPVVADRPKALVAIDGRPFLFFLLDQLVAAGANRIVLCTGHLGDQVRETIGDSYSQCPVIYSHETSPMGTAGALRQAIHCCEGNLWLVSNGDSYIASDLQEFVAWYCRSEKNGALLLTWVEDTSRFGTVELGETGMVARFQEKRGLPVPGWINAGVYLLPRQRIEALPSRIPLSLEREAFPDWTGEGLAALGVKAPFIDIGTPDSLRGAARFFAAGR